jgi:hypothetical protein
LANPLSRAKAARKELTAPDGYLAGISREPMVVNIPGNIAAAYRAWAGAGHAGLPDTILDTLRSGAVLALEESGRDDVPSVNDRNEWLMEGAVMDGVRAWLDAAIVRQLIQDAVGFFRGVGISMGDTPRGVIAEYRRQKRAGKIEAGAIPIFDREAKALEALDAVVPNVDVSDVR